MSLEMPASVLYKQVLPGSRGQKRILKELEKDGG